MEFLKNSIVHGQWLCIELSPVNVKELTRRIGNRKKRIIILMTIEDLRSRV